MSLGSTHGSMFAIEIYYRVMTSLTLFQPPTKSKHLERQYNLQCHEVCVMFETLQHGDVVLRRNATRKRWHSHYYYLPILVLDRSLLYYESDWSNSLHFIKIIPVLK